MLQVISAEQLKRHVEGHVRSLAAIEDGNTRTLATLKSQMELAALTGTEDFEFLFPLVERVRKNPELLPPPKQEKPDNHG